MFFHASNIPLNAPEIPGFGNDTIKVTERYFTKNSIPWLPVMGEFHYSRYNCEDWEKELLKMKKSGIEVVSSYVFWIHHEKTEGVFDWSHNQDLRAFLSLCQKHGLSFFLRPGPWAHGECRNGGFPDWLLEKCKGKTRCSSEPYLSYVKRFFGELANQVKGLPNIIGIQVENELVQDPDYLLQIKKIILESGMNAPIFTATGWGYSPLIPTNELLPVYGGYPEAPWEQHTKELSPSSHYFFEHERNDAIIGNDSMVSANSDAGKGETNNRATPFLTCETGGGIQVTYHRRPIIQPKDVAAISLTLLGGGCNMLGYYMYHGGKNPIFETCTTQESRATFYANDYPMVSYDFQAPIGECGQLRGSYQLFTQLHSFVNSFGKWICPMESIFPDEVPTGFQDTETLRAAIRTDGKSGFLFVNNYQRLRSLPTHERVEIKIELAAETLTVSGIHVEKDSYFILPFNLPIGKKLLKYALAQPFSMDGNVWSFLQIDGMEPHFYFEDCDFILTDAGYQFDGMELRLVKKEANPPTQGKELQAVLSENEIAFDRFAYLGFADHTREYRLNWEEDFKFLKINCVGNVAQAYYQNELLADWFCNGTDWVIDVRKLEKKELLIKIQPLLPEDAIYFETEMPRETTAIAAVGISADEIYI